jgi:hypothetical protein
MVLPVLMEKTSVAAPIPQDVKRAVTFIFSPNKSGQPMANGTGFFVGVTNEYDPNLVNPYLVTAKHVLTEKKTNSFFPHIWIRINKRSGDSHYFKISLSGTGAAQVFTHEDPNVDIAVIPIVFDTNVIDFKYIPENLITTKEMFENLKIAEGDEIFFVGLFTGYYGIEKNYPIMRFGRVALITDEKIPWLDKNSNKAKLLELYLVETQSFGGNSGSPVFFWLDPTRDTKLMSIGPHKLLLAGIMKGNYSEAKPIKLVETNVLPLAYENVGIAAVIPAYSLHEILFCDELRKFRHLKKKN